MQKIMENRASFSGVALGDYLGNSLELVVLLYKIS